MSSSHTASVLALGDAGGAIPARAPVVAPAGSVVAIHPGCRRRRDRRATDRRATESERGAQLLVAGESRRFAAQVHDLIMQDLSYALASARALEDDPALASRITAIVASAERALAGAREVLGDLSARERKPLADVFAESVRAAARDTPLTFQLPSTNGDQPDAATIDALVHIGREAVTNAVKHGHAHEILVVLEHDEEWRLLVTDRGSGFDTAARQGTSVVSDANGTGDFKGPDGANGRDGGFGLESMRRHAQALGGRLSVRSSPGEGTTVEAVLP